MTPEITAIIPTFNRAKLLKRSVRSVLGQTYPNFTLLIADNASEDETRDVIADFMRQDKRVQLLKQSTNLGMVKNFQAALMQVTTPLVCFLPDDDFYTPFFFEEALPFFRRYPEIAFCGGGYLLMDESYRIKTITQNHQKSLPSGYYAPPSGLFAYYRSSFAIAFPPLLFQTEILKQFGGFDLRIRNGADVHLVSQCAARHAIYLMMDRPLFFSWLHAGSLSRQIDFPLVEREGTYLHENMSALSFSEDERKEIDTFYRDMKLKTCSLAYRYFYQNKEYANAQMYAEKVFLLNQRSKWKRKARHAALCQSLPYLGTFYDTFKNIEKRLRTSFKCAPKESGESIVEDPIPEEAEWRSYAMSLLS